MRKAKHLPRFALLALLLANVTWAADNSVDTAKHLGVATCASSTCHGKISPDGDSPVAQNEYFIWSKYDHHADAYKVLQNARSRRIAANMGINDAATAQQCLVCHTDNVPLPQRGARFHLSDGIGCETCHGGAEGWIDSHYDPDVTRTENVERGMLPTWKPAFQAKQCQSCHLGDNDHFITHEMMAAGHPNLRFELDTWQANMPPHHVVDADYIDRNGSFGNVDRWALGMVTTSHAHLKLLQKHIGRNALVPEFSLFDCHACHRPMDTSVTRSNAEKRMNRAGSIRPDDHALGMLAIIVAPRNPQLARELRDGIRALHGAASQSVSVFMSRVARLDNTVQRANTTITRALFSTSERKHIRRALLHEAAQGQFRDYADAEQLYLALQALATQEHANADQYNALFDLLDNEQNFQPDRVAAAAQRLLD